MAQSRYEISSVKKFNNKEYLSNTMMPKIEQEIHDTYIIANESDRLDFMAHKYYGDSELYWVICLANDILDGNLFPEIGSQICIPNVDRLQDIFFKIKQLNKDE